MPLIGGDIVFVTPKLVYTELHKTGGSHIRRWLAEVLVGEQIGKHNRIPAHLWDRFIVGSVRNPWDWYVSLWAYGCGKKGSVYSRTTRRFDLSYYKRQLHPEMGQKRTNLKYSTQQFLHDMFKPVDSWQATYHDYKDILSFRRWLSMLLDDKRRYDVGEGYGFSPVSRRFGLMTYRLLKLYTKLGNQLYEDSDLATLPGIHDVWQRKRLSNYMICSESLEDDLLTAISRAGHIPTDEQRNAILAARHQKTNTSKRLPVEHYYDQENLDLVLRREQFVIEMFAYLPPKLSEENTSI